MWQICFSVNFSLSFSRSAPILSNLPHNLLCRFDTFARLFWTFVGKGNDWEVVALNSSFTEELVVENPSKTLFALPILGDAIRCRALECHIFLALTYSRFALIDGSLKATLFFSVFNNVFALFFPCLFVGCFSLLTATTATSHIVRWLKNELLLSARSLRFPAFTLSCNAPLCRRGSWLPCIQPPSLVPPAVFKSCSSRDSSKKSCWKTLLLASLGIDWEERVSQGGMGNGV